MPSRRHTIRHFAAALAAGSPNEDALRHRAESVLGSRPRWLRPLLREFRTEFGEDQRASEADVVRFLRRSERFARAWARHRVVLAGSLLGEPEMVPAAGAPRSWDLPPLTGAAEVAAFLGLDPGQLHWLTRPGSRDHYVHRWIPKRRGGLRLVESPKPLLKRVQRRLLDALLVRIPVHESCHGFRPGGSVRSFVAPHAGRDMLLKIDLQDFFPSVSAGRVFRIFLTAGYPDAVSRTLARLLTHATPRSELRASLTPSERARFLLPHLPQGAPGSPAVANLAAFRLDCRLHGLAEAAGAIYTRYADDLLVSGDRTFARSVERFRHAAYRIILEEGFRPHPRKTRTMHASQRQQAAGIVLNEVPGIDRRERDRLKAILTNAIRHGLPSQNREGHPDFRAHLAGRVSWVESVHPAQGARLRALLDRLPP
jgi:hypothetical protein